MRASSTSIITAQDVRSFAFELSGLAHIEAHGGPTGPRGGEGESRRVAADERQLPHIEIRGLDFRSRSSRVADAQQKQSAALAPQ